MNKVKNDNLDRDLTPEEEEKKYRMLNSLF